MEQYSNFCGVMEAENHFKNGTSLKSLMIRVNFLRKACFALLSAGIILSGCKKGEVVSIERAVGEFSGISLEGATDVKIHPSNDYKVVVTTHDNIQEVVVVEVKDDILRIYEKNNRFNAKTLQVEVYLPELTSITTKGAGDITVFEGSTSDLEINISGAGDINAQKFEVENVVIKHSGAGDVKIWVKDVLTGSHSGAGDILYKGNPTISVQKTGAGDIKKL